MAGTITLGGQTLASHDTASNTITLENVDTATIGSNALVVNSSGNIRIGNDSSSITNGKLVINTLGTTSPTNLTNLAPSSINLFSGSSGSSTDGTTGIFGWNASTGIGSGIGFIRENSTNWGTQIRFYTHPTNTNSIGDVTERMRIDSSGNVLVATTNTNAAGSNVVGISLGADGQIDASRNGASLDLNRISTDGSIANFRKNGTTVGSISITGSSASYNTSSDYRLKENITDITDGISRIKQLNPSRFNFIADPNTTVDGFIAHEVQTIIPEAVSGEKDAVNEDGSINPQGIDQSKLIPLLTAALQEALVKIEQLETRVIELENK